MSKELQRKNNFSSSLGFLFSAIAAAVGLSNIWRFPAEAAKHGGGIYVLVYIICIIVVGYPIILSELAFGRSKKQSIYDLYKGTGMWKWSGALAAFACFLIFCFYNVVSGWVLAYIWHFVAGFFRGKGVDDTIYHLRDAPIKNYIDFFETVRGSLWGNLICTLLMVLFAIFILQAGVSGGIEKCSKILMPLFVLVMLGLIGYSCSLAGASNGIWRYISPSSKFTLAGLASALSQSLVSLAIGMGALVTYGAYVDKSDNLYRSSFIIGVGDTAVAFFAGFFLFAFMGHSNPDILDPKTEIAMGTGLAFQTLPHILVSKFSEGVACLIGASFFLLVFFAAITSSITLLEVPSRYIERQFKLTRNQALWLVAGVSFLISILCILTDSYKLGWDVLNKEGKTVLKTIHDFYQDIVVYVVAPLSTFLFVLFISFKWKVENLFKECSGQKKVGKYFAMYIRVSLTYICPVLTALSFGYSLYVLFTGQA